MVYQVALVLSSVERPRSGVLLAGKPRSASPNAYMEAGRHGGSSSLTSDYRY